MSSAGPGVVHDLADGVDDKRRGVQVHLLTAVGLGDVLGVEVGR
jgi:hypothetical protein